VLKHLGSIRDYQFYENERHGTFTIIHKGKAIAHPTTIEQVLQKMEYIGRTRPMKR